MKSRYEITAAWWARTAAMAIIGIATVTGNGAVLVALKKVQRAPSHYPLASLATADLLVGLFVLPMSAAREQFEFHLSTYPSSNSLAFMTWRSRSYKDNQLITTRFYSYFFK